MEAIIEVIAQHPIIKVIAQHPILFIVFVIWCAIGGFITSRL